MEQVTLKNGYQVADVLVPSVTLHLKSLINDGQVIVLYEIVEKARDAKHEMFGNTQETAARLGLMDTQGTMHEDVRQVILNAIQGKDFDMQLVSPIQHN